MQRWQLAQSVQCVVIRPHTGLTHTRSNHSAAFTIWRGAPRGKWGTVCMRVCVLYTCVWGRERPQSPRDSVSHKLHHKAALLGLAWVRPLLSSSNMPATCSHTFTATHMNMHTRTCSHIHMCTRSPYKHTHAHTHRLMHTQTSTHGLQRIHLVFSGNCNKNTKSGRVTFISQDPRVEG